MLRNNVFWHQFQNPFGDGAWSHQTGKFSDGPWVSGIDSFALPSSAKNTMHAIFLWNERDSRRKGTRKILELHLHAAAWIRPLGCRWVEGMAWKNISRGCYWALGFPVVKWVDSALEKQDWVNMWLSLPTGNLQGGLRLSPVHSNFLEVPSHIWLPLVHP